MYKTDSKKVPSSKNYTNAELIGKRVRVTSNASHRHYKKFGRIVGFSKAGDYVNVYFDESDSVVKFCRGSLELIN